ncbi:MAG: replicative DNA helicase, partial [Anaerolineae bacterium]
LRNELEARGILEEVGGVAYLARLIDAVPTAIHVEAYGRIVEEAAIRRRLISAAGDIAQLAYQEGQEIGEVLDRAEQALFAISQRRITRDLVPIQEVIRPFYDRIEYLYTHQGEPLGVPTGFIDLDKLLGGLQKSDLIIVAARPGMGKTSFCLSVARNAARMGKHVAIFSLEMSAEQVVQRLVSAETGIDAQRLRLGQLREEEWPLLVQATGVLSELPIFIDDTPAISALQLRTKARRIHAEYGLDLIVVDYLQLMTSDVRVENRVQEVSYISRMLKSLARELDVPLLAVSQLSRAVEQRTDKRPVLADLRESGCLTGDTLVQLADGQRIPIRLLAQNGASVTVMALNEETWKLEPILARKAWRVGVAPVFRLRTRLGREIRATANHRFRTIEGWKRLDELKPGDHIALSRSWAVLEKVQAFQEFYRQRRHNTNRDVLPREVWRSLVEPARQAVGLSTREMQALMGHRYCGTALFKSNLSRERAFRVGEIVRSEELIRLSQSDVYWDRIASIEEAGEEEVFDLEVPGHHNFVAGDIIVHNSLEQDADVVMFIYREEMYKPETEKQHIADIIVAKHRHGPTRTVQLFFREQLAQFLDAETRIRPVEFA